MTDHAIVISVVYDGPPLAGKTTSVRSLARGFGREVYTPEERNGRTMYFDWLEYVGGRFEGAPIHCQIASVPGQRRWTRRRGHFLDRADVVVFVGDTTAAAWPETVERLRELRAQLDARTGPPVGLVFQANKRDVPDAVPIDEVLARVGNARTAVIESVAHEGIGVRETFVFAVRLALDRVRDERDRNSAAGSRPGFGPVQGQELVAQLDRLDGDAVPEEGSVTANAPSPPSQDVPSGFVWPPIEGRILLRQASQAASGAVQITAEGDCSLAGGTGWRFHSSGRSVFEDMEEARAALILWARQHAAAQTVVSRRRCIVLAAAGGNRWRLWQIVQREPSVRDLPDAARDNAQRLVGELAAACKTLALTLPCTLDTTGVSELERPVYIGLMPPVRAVEHA